MQIVLNRKGQMKIQQMAFILVALIIFLSMASLIYFSIRISSLKGSANSLEEKNALENIRKIAGLPEFSFSSAGDCAGCIDFDKVLILKERKSYKEFWDFDYLAIEKLEKGEECNRENYPDCGKILIINKTENFGKVTRSFAPLCRWENLKGGYFKCEMGQILASGRNIG